MVQQQQTTPHYLLCSSIHGTINRTRMSSRLYRSVARILLIDLFVKPDRNLEELIAFCSARK